MLRAIRFCRHVGAARHAVRHIHGVGVRGGSSLFEGDGPVREWRHDKPEHGKRGQQVPNGEMSLHVAKIPHPPSAAKGLQVHERATSCKTLVDHTIFGKWSIAVALRR